MTCGGCILIRPGDGQCYFLEKLSPVSSMDPGHEVVPSVCATQVSALTLDPSWDAGLPCSPVSSDGEALA